MKTDLKYKIYYQAKKKKVCDLNRQEGNEAQVTIINYLNKVKTREMKLLK